MKKNENKKNRNWRNFVVLTLVCMIAATLVGCKTSTAVTPEPSTSEVVSEPVSVPVSEEVSEPASEEPSEVVSEETVEEVEIVNYSTLNDFANYLKELNKTTIVEYNFSIEGSSQAIIPNEAKYTMQMSNILGVYPGKEVTNIVANVDYIDIMEPMRQNIWMVYVNTSGTDVEVSFTLNYADGTSEDFTIYVSLSKPHPADNI